MMAMVNDPVLEDAQALAKAIVTSMLAEPARLHPGDRTSSLLQAALGAPREDAEDDPDDDAARTRAVIFMLADIASAAINLLADLGVDVQDELVSPYLLPEAIG